MTERRVVLLGPQRQQPGVRKAVADLGAMGPLAVVTAGWEERESEDDELVRDLAANGRQNEQTINLALFPRADDLYRREPAVRDLMTERETRRKALRDLYHLRLAPQLEACRRLLDRVDPSEADALYGPEIDHAIVAIRSLDEHHLQRIVALEEEVAGRLDDHPILVDQRGQVADLVAGSAALLIAGGHVGTLTAMLRLFAVMDLTVDKPVVAWSAGAMAIAERIVLFHDSPARGAGDAEVFGPGFGLVGGIVPLPHARHRLALDDPRRVALMARRFEPLVLVGLDYSGRIDRADDSGPSSLGSSGWQASGRAGVLQSNGHVVVTGAAPSQAEGDESGLDATSSPDGHTGQDDPVRDVPAEPEPLIAALALAARSGGEALRRAVQAYDFPIVGDGWALYVHLGPANAVKLRHWVSGLPSVQPFRRIPGTDLWTFVGELQPKARVEYKFEISNDHGAEWICDPLNPDTARDPFGANSVVRGPQYRRPEWADEHESARRGQVVHHELDSAVFGGQRPYSVYLPARFRPERRYPLVVVHDGIDYLQYASLAAVLDNLIHRLEIPPLVAALIQSPNRLPEYGANPDHGRFLVEDLVPDLESRYRLADPSQRVLLGASFGAVASLSAAWAHPGRFQKLLLQSGSFAFTDVGPHDLGPVFDPVVEFVNQFRQDPGRPAERIFLSAGIYETLIYFNRSLLPVLQSTGAQVKMVEAQDGHNWENWRDHLRAGLTWLLPGPQWLIYE